MQQTANLDLELYEATDNANLLDGYNASMRKIDTRDGEISTLISALNTTVTGYDTRITTAQSTADGAATAASNAASAAATADGKAVAAQADATAAQADATAALTALAGQTLEVIGDADKGTKWSTIDQSSYIDETKTTLNGVIVETATAAVAILHVGLEWSSTGTVAATATPVIRLRDWEFVSGHGELYGVFSYMTVLKDKFHMQAGVNAYDINLNNVTAITADATGKLSCVIVAHMVRRTQG